MSGRRWQACTRCGSTDLRSAMFEEAALAEGADLQQVECQNCGLRGGPLVFDDEKSLRAYQGSLGETD